MVSSFTEQRNTQNTKAHMGWRLAEMELVEVEGHKGMFLCHPRNKGDSLPPFSTSSPPGLPPETLLAKVRRCATDVEFQQCMREVNANETVAGALVAEYIGFDVRTVADSSREVALFFRYYPGGSLRGRMGAPDDILKRLLLHSALAVLSLHVACPENPIAHRCISLDHILTGSGPDTVVLCDMRGTRSTALCNLSLDQLLQARREVDALVPSPDLIPPEMIALGVGRCGRVDERSDAWQLGHTFFELMFGCSPFVCVPHKCRGMLTLPLEANKRPLLQLLSKLLHPVPAKRLTVYEVVCHLSTQLQIPVASYPAPTRPQPSVAGDKVMKQGQQPKSPFTMQSAMKRLGGIMHSLLTPSAPPWTPFSNRPVPPSLLVSPIEAVRPDGPDVPASPIGEPRDPLPSPHVPSPMKTGKDLLILEKYWPSVASVHPSTGVSGGKSTTSWENLSHHTLDEYDVVCVEDSPLKGSNDWDTLVM